MGFDEILCTCAAPFCPVEREVWDAIIADGDWRAFLSCAFSIVGEDDRVRLSKSTLLMPPSFEEKEAFARRHFTGGLPESAMPVESLYRSDEEAGDGEALYFRSSAEYMADVTKRMGVSIPRRYGAFPDHLSIELEFAAFLVRSGLEAQAKDFVAHRFQWLDAYRAKLQLLPADAAFYADMVDLIAHIADKWPRGTGRKRQREAI